MKVNNVKQINAFGGVDAPRQSGVDSDLTFDQKFKQLFSKREFLTPILYNVVPEYRSCSLTEIERLISPHGDITVNPNVYTSEDSGKGEETVTHYDVFVDCALPNNNGSVCVNFFFDLEMQRENKPGYPISKRGVYYCCRLISRQIEALKEESYNQLKPVYSVWNIKNDVPEELANSVYTANLCGEFDDSHKDASMLNKEVDLIHLSLVYLSKDLKAEAAQNDLIKYLNSVFRRQVDNPEFNPYYNYSKEIKKEVDETMSLEEAIRQAGEARGEAIGKVELLLEDGLAEDQIIIRLTTRGRNPLTEEQVKEALRSIKKENR